MFVGDAKVRARIRHRQSGFNGRSLSFELGGFQIVWRTWSIRDPGLREEPEMAQQPCAMNFGSSYTAAQPPRPDYALVSLQVEILKNVLSHLAQYLERGRRDRAAGVSNAEYRPPEYLGQSRAWPFPIAKAPMSWPAR
jgi:hypothetical protein